jgi:hypothetical protein
VERAIASYQAQGHDVDVVEVVDDEANWFRVIVDGELLPGYQHFDRPPTDAEATAIIDEWTHSFRTTRHCAEQGTTTTDAAGPARQEPFSAEDIREHAKHANTVNEVMQRRGGRLHRAKTTEPRNVP